MRERENEEDIKRKKEETQKEEERLHCCKRVVHLNFRSPENRAVESP